MILEGSLFIAGVITLVWGVTGLILIRKQVGEKIFTENRPLWLGVLCWIYLTLALVAVIDFLRKMQSISFVIVAILILTSSKFLYFYFSYPHWQIAFVTLWKNKSVFWMILGSSIFVGLLMILMSWLFFRGFV